MVSWVITYNSVKSGGKRLPFNYEVIYGKTAKAALEQHFNRKFVRMTGDRSRFADVILVKGSAENNTIKYSGRRYLQLCFCVVDEEAKE